MKTINFRGEANDISAKKEAILIGPPVWMFDCFAVLRYSVATKHLNTLTFKHFLKPFIIQFEVAMVYDT